MRGLSHHIGSSSMALVTENVDVVTAFRKLMILAAKKTRHVFCSVVNGGHELSRARTETKLYQECLLCGYETAGWTIDRKDRRLHLVAKISSPASVASRR